MHLAIPKIQTVRACTTSQNGSQQIVKKFKSCVNECSGTCIMQSAYVFFSKKNYPRIQILNDIKVIECCRLCGAFTANAETRSIAYPGVVVAPPSVSFHACDHYAGMCTKAACAGRRGGRE